MSRIIDAFSQFFDDAGDPLVNGWLAFKDSGTNTDKATYSDSSLTVANTNPVQLDGAGRCPSIFGIGAYKVISYKDSVVTPGTPGEQVQQFDPVGGDEGDQAFGDWASTNIYVAGDIVTGSDGNYYRSLTSNNQANDPVSSPSDWEQVTLNRIWNVNVEYTNGDQVVGSDGLNYTCVTASSVGDDPTTDDRTNWSSATKAKLLEWETGVTYSAGQSVQGSDGVVYFSKVSNSGNNPISDAGVNWQAYDQVRNAAAGGAVDAITASFVPAMAALSNAVVVRVRAAGANTSTTPTFAADGLAAKTIVKHGNQALEVGDIVGSGHEVLLCYNSTNDNWELLNPGIDGANKDLSNLSNTGETKIARAWCCLNGTGTIAVRSSYNVTSITDVGVGDYRVNWSVTFPDVNYGVAGTCRSPDSNNHTVNISDLEAPTTTTTRVKTESHTTTQTDCDYVMVMVLNDE